MLGELYREWHTARATLDQNGFASFELRRILKGPQCGETSQRHSGRLGMAKALGFPGDDRGLDGDFFRVRAFDALIADPEHRVADGEVSDIRAGRADHAREVTAQDIGKVNIGATTNRTL